MIDLAESVGLSVYAPQVELPLTTSYPADHIAAANEYALANSAGVVFIPEGAGPGVFFELGYASALGKVIICYAADGVAPLGKTIEGVVSRLGPGQRAATPAQLRDRLVTFRDILYPQELRSGTFSPVA